MEFLQLGLGLSIHNPIKKLIGPKDHMETKCKTKNKRDFEEAFGKSEDDHEMQTLPLLLWNEQPNEEDEHKEDSKIDFFTTNMNEEEEEEEEEEEDHVVGWPHVESWRKKILLQHHGGCIQNDNGIAEENGETNPIYVKVKMEGVAITRKIDLSLYQSYQTLKSMLISIFTKPSQRYEQIVANYTLTYQDKDGDWLLAGDVPWEAFIESVQRLEILRNCGS